MDIPTPEQLVKHYEDFCRRHNMAETRFGRDSTGEPQLIASIRGGRSPSLKVMNRVASFMAEHDGDENNIDRSIDAAGKSDNFTASEVGSDAAVAA